MDGNRTMNCHNFMVQNINLKMDGNSTTNLNCTEELDLDIDGSANVCYKGNPTIVSGIDGNGKVKKCN